MNKTAKPARGVKSAAIRKALRSYPHMRNKEVAQMLTNKGIKCSSQDVANQKARLKRMGKIGEKDDFTLDDLKRVKAMVAKSGGIDQVQTKLKEIEDMAKKVGGIDKLRRGLEELPDFMNA
jgi:alcohol dehydrogenase YqhD (iron-dependent ADH family)